MKAFQFVFQEGLGKGLRRFDYNARNNQSLVECHNAMPDESGLVPHERVVSLNDGGTGEGKLAPYSPTRDIIITDYVTTDDVENASVYLDGVLQGLTDANGEIEVADVAIGTHSLRITAVGYIHSEDDDLSNDYLVVT